MMATMTLSKSGNITGLKTLTLQNVLITNNVYAKVYTGLITAILYVFRIIEAKTRMPIQFYINKKSDVGECIRIWYEMYIKALRLAAPIDDLKFIFLNTDMGESTKHSIINYLKTVGIELLTTCPHTPKQNMIIERVWRTIGESAIAIKRHAMYTIDHQEHMKRSVLCLRTNNIMVYFRIFRT